MKTFGTLSPIGFYDRCIRNGFLLLTDMLFVALYATRGFDDAFKVLGRNKPSGKNLNRERFLFVEFTGDQFTFEFKNKTIKL